MSTYKYSITIKTQKGLMTIRYRSPEKLQAGEELLVFYEGANHLIRVITISKALKGVVQAEEI